MTIQRDQQKRPSIGALVDSAIENRLKSLRTATPGFITAFDKATQTASVQPAIKITLPDGTQKDLPLCLDVPVKFPRGGDFVMTFPVKAGDECLIVFSDRCIDGWFSGGSTAAPADYRMHDLSDGFAFVGFSSSSGKVSDFADDGAVIRSLDNKTKVTLGNDGSIASVTKNGSHKMTADGAITIDAPNGLTINAPNITLNGNTLVKGNISGQSGNGGNGSGTFTGSMAVTGDVTAGNISLQGHHHSDPQGGSTGGAEA